MANAAHPTGTSDTAIVLPVLSSLTGSWSNWLMVTLIIGSCLAAAGFTTRTSWEAFRQLRMGLRVRRSLRRALENGLA